MVRHVLLASLCVFSMAAFTLADEKAKFDAKELQGKWKITAGTKFGDKLEGKSLEGEITIDGDKITIKSPDITHVMSFKIDAAKSPVAIDMTGLEGPAKDAKAEGIIKVEKGEVTLAYSFPGEKRPEKFESAKESKVFLFTLKPIK
jgi:uncharacterized protein (TIGR03067 family)